jgi:hypothetical protein
MARIGEWGTQPRRYRRLPVETALAVGTDADNGT